MENFPFRPYHEADRAHNTFFAPPNFENFASPFFGAQDFHKARLNPTEAQSFLSFSKEEGQHHDMHDRLKNDGFALDNHSFVPQNNLDAGHDNSMLTKPQEFNMEFNRINRSRGPSFNLGYGRKTSEDFFAHGFDFLNYFNKNQDQQQTQRRERLFSMDGLDNQIQAGFLDFRTNPMNANPAALGNFAMHAENILQFNIQPEAMMAAAAKDHQAFYNQNQAMISHFQTQPQQQQPEKQEDNQDASDFESINKKKKLNNAQESVVLQPAQLLAAIQAKKPKAGEKEVVAAESKESKPKKSRGKKAKEVDNSDKSTQPSVNVSPNPKKEDIMSTFNNGNFATFKKPETAQELLGGLSLPAEVEEYINNSKIFNQIKAPVIKRIGTLTVEERKIKIDKYLEKRKRRTWNKRVNYDCRKKVADNRLRIKGRFVTKDQAFSMLEAFEIPFDPETITNVEIKELLTERFGSIVPKKKNLGETQDAKERIGMTFTANNTGAAFNFADFGVEDGGSFGSQDD